MCVLSYPGSVSFVERIGPWLDREFHCYVYSEQMVSLFPLLCIRSIVYTEHVTSVQTKTHREYQAVSTSHRAPMETPKAHISSLVALPVTSRYPTTEAWTQDIL